VIISDLIIHLILALSIRFSEHTIEMATYTCITCRVMFTDKDGNEGGAAELQKEHYKTDWHRYNLKRKVADLPPVTAENFQQRVLVQKEQVGPATISELGFVKTTNNNVKRAFV